MSYTNPLKQREYQRLWKRKRCIENRKNAMALLGGRCVSCGNDDSRVLEFDHIEILRRDKKSAFRGYDTGFNLTSKILRGIIDKRKVQILCANCHKIKTYKDRLKYNNYIP